MKQESVMRFVQQRWSVRVIGLSVVFVLVIAGLTCHKASSGWDSFDENTIEQDLAVVDSANVVYWAQLAAGHRDSAVLQAQAVLFAHPGTDTVQVAPDSTVWVFFANGLETGLGELAGDSTSARGGTPGSNAQPVKIASGTPGGDIYRAATFVVPFSDELLGTEEAADTVSRRLERLRNWGSTSTYLDTFVTVENARALIHGQSPVLFWAGHGMLLPVERGGRLCTEGLLTGKPYSRVELAKAAANEYRSYLHPGQGKPRQAAAFHSKVWGEGYMVILPPFIRAYGDFSAWNLSGNYNYTKTIVYLDCCCSACGEANGSHSDLIQSFLDVGADLVCGWDWSVHDGFAENLDTMFFNRLCDTFLPKEAERALGNTTDPVPIGPRCATLKVTGDTLVMVEPVLLAQKNGALWRADQVIVESTARFLNARGDLYTQSGNYYASLYVLFPPAARTYDPTIDSASIEWDDQSTMRDYRVQRGDKGVSGVIKIDQLGSHVIMGTFSGTLGWWSAEHDPTKDPPDDVVELTDGRIKFTGKMQVSK
ncbi:MAG TPA: hypothetical protein VMH22_14915 [bacterium]|nr:hypothetical protein [bacterium]